MQTPANAQHLVQGSGSGPLLVLLHGIGLGKWIWERDQAHWAETLGLSSLALDFKGHGSEAGQDVRLEELADQVNALLDTLDQPVVLVGHSMGGLVAQMVASRRELHGVVCVASAPPKGVFLRPTKAGIRAILPKLAGLVRGKPLALSDNAYLACGFDQLEEPTRGQALARLIPWPNALAKDLAIGRPDIPLGGISSPILVIHGFKDPIVTLHQSRLLADHYGAVLWRFDDVAHHPMLEPSGLRITEAIAEFALKPTRRLVREIDAFSPEQGIGKGGRDARDPNPMRSDSKFGDRRR
ncbi:MAG: pimeloyl-ACP methyl ester carboxylesterase [Cognaticolwellia sp.]|jgi:pimeloyl-ACP methyl ester carboxylesterase